MAAEHFNPPALPDDFLPSVKRLCVAARTTGGTAGRDEGLCAALTRVEQMLLAIDDPDWQAQATQRPSLRDELQQQCSTWGAYWRASDSHGVDLTQAQAVELLENALGVEVEIKTTVCHTCNDRGVIGGPSYYNPDEGGVPCPDCTGSPATEEASALALEALEVVESQKPVKGVVVLDAQEQKLVSMAAKALRGEKAEGAAP